jgi:hypothetical protein
VLVLRGGAAVKYGDVVAGFVMDGPRPPFGDDSFNGETTFGIPQRSRLSRCARESSLSVLVAAASNNG